MVEKLDYYRSYIKLLSERETSTFLSFQDFFKHGCSCEERSTLKSFRQLICKFLSSFTGDIAQPNGWKKYGILDAKSNIFKFCPGLFVRHLKCLLDFQEILVKTRLFNKYVNQRKEEE